MSYSPVSNIALIVDYTAAVAAGIEGVKSVAGAGQGETDDPLRPGYKIAACAGAPSEPYQHWSELPDAPSVQWLTQNATVELTWELPMRLWLPRGDFAMMRQMALPFYDGYLGAFIRDRLLSGLVIRSEITHIERGGDDSWSWLEVMLTLTEVVNYGSVV